MAVIDKQYQTQMRGGTYNDNLVRLQSEFFEIVKSGVSPRGLHHMLGRLLKAFENQRVECNRQIRKLEAELNFNEGTANACCMFSNLILSMLEGYNRDGLLSGISPEEMKKSKDIEQVEKVEEEVDKLKKEEERIKAEMLKKYCANCGCQDEGDMEKCDCSCHNGKHCGNEHCIVCNDLSNYFLLKKKKRSTRKKKK